MHNVFPKFIIETNDIIGDHIILAKCTYHYQLAFDQLKVKSGGWWKYDKEANIFTLYGESDKFGMAKFDDIKKCIDSDFVFSSRSRVNNLAKKHGFSYFDGIETIIIKKSPNENITSSE